MERFGRYGTARFFEPDDRLLDASLQQMHGPDQVVPRTDVGIAGAETNGLLSERDHLVQQPGEEFTPPETVQCTHQVPIQRERRLVFGNGLVP